MKGKYKSTKKRDRENSKTAHTTFTHKRSMRHATMCKTFVRTETWPLLTRSKRKSCLFRFDRRFKPFFSLVVVFYPIYSLLLCLIEWLIAWQWQKPFIRLQESIFSNIFWANKRKSQRTNEHSWTLITDSQCGRWEKKQIKKIHTYMHPCLYDVCFNVSICFDLPFQFSANRENNKYFCLIFASFISFDFADFQVWSVFILQSLSQPHIIVCLLLSKKKCLSLCVVYEATTNSQRRKKNVPTDIAN